MAPNEQASEKFNPPTIPPSGPCFPSGRRGVSRTAGGPDAGLGRRRPRAGAWGLHRIRTPTSPRHCPVRVLGVAEDTHTAMTEGWRGGGPGDLRTPRPDPISLERGLCQPSSTGEPRLRSVTTKNAP
eukprot:6208253-Pleurochrysis_carterae.AAC.1